MIISRTKACDIRHAICLFFLFAKQGGVEGPTSLWWVYIKYRTDDDEF